MREKKFTKRTQFSQAALSETRLRRENEPSQTHFRRVPWPRVLVDPPAVDSMDQNRDSHGAVTQVAPPKTAR